jgi:hypothetical protein
MAEAEAHQNGDGNSPSTAITAVAAAAVATGAATYAVKRLGSRKSGPLRKPVERAKTAVGGGKSLDVSSAGEAVWDAASKTLLPIAENAAEAAGRYLAESAPDVVRQQIVPRFIDGFNDAS